MLGTIEFRDVSKVYGATLALSAFSARFEPGRVHALMGKNGSGKSTAIKLLAGAVAPTTGEIWIGGQPVRLASPRDAFAAGIVTVHQELSLVGSLSVAENMFLGRLKQKRAFGARFVDWRAMNVKTRAMLAESGLDIAPEALAGSLSIGQQQMVEIIKAMSSGPSILLLDEPTSSLASDEVRQLFSLVRRLRDRGVTMIYITHRMTELFEIADTCTVLRDGRLVGTAEMGATTPEAIVEMMFGDVARAVRPARRALRRENPVLAVEGLTRKPAFADVSFALHRGEILGLAGLLGAGRTEVMRAIFGADPVDAGRIVFDGEVIAAPNPRLMKAKGVGYTPENRKEVGLVQPLSIHDNLIMASLETIAPASVTTRAREAPFVAGQIRDLSIKAREPMLPVASLSGGNQQKVVIGKWLNTSPKVMFFDEPSRGVDVQAKQQIFEIMWRKSEQGLSCLFVSSELEEVLDVCDRILVMHHGRIVGECLPQDTSLTALYRYCMQGSLS